jgi:hypothetical protein
MRPTVALAVLAGCLSLVGPARAAGACDYWSAAWHSRVFVVGDSVANAARDDLTRAYEVNAQHGRPVSCLPSVLRRRKADAPALKVVVIALGTNISPGWTYEDYRDAVNMFPLTTWVVLVTPYRDPSKVPDMAPTIARYATWMRVLGKHRNVLVADWAAYVDAHRDLLDDGVHPSEEGRVVWAHLVTTRVERARAHPPT